MSRTLQITDIQRAERSILMDSNMKASSGHAKSIIGNSKQSKAYGEATCARYVANPL